MLLHVNFALKTRTTVAKEEIRRVMVVQWVGFLLLAVPNVWFAGQERMVLVVKVVFPVTTAQAVWNQRRVVFVQLVSVKVIMDKRHASNAVPENSIIFLVLLHVNHALQTLITVAKEETQRVLNVQWVGRRWQVVQIVKRVVQECMVLGVKIVKSVYFVIQQ